MLFCAISEEKTSISGALSFYCRKYRVEGKEMFTFRDTIFEIFCCKLWKFVNVQGNYLILPNVQGNYLIFAWQNKLNI